MLSNQQENRRFKLRELISPRTSDNDVLHFAAAHDYVLITRNRNDFLVLAQVISHAGLIGLIRRANRVRERVALFRLLDKAGEAGIRYNINFA